MLDKIRRYYGFEAHGADFRREGIAGLTTFMTMSYIIGGRYWEVRPGLWVLGLLSLLFFTFYPYT